MANKTLPAAVALFCAWLFADAPLLAAPSPVRSYVWSGELVGINRDARLAILKAEFREHVLRYIEQFKPGDRVFAVDNRCPPYESVSRSAPSDVEIQTSRWTFGLRPGGVSTQCGKLKASRRSR